MAGIEMGKIGLAAALFVAPATLAGCKDSSEPEGWVGNDITDIADSFFVKDYGYADCPDTAGKVWPIDTTRIDCMPFFDEKSGQKHLLPNPAKVQMAFFQYPDVAPAIDTKASYSSVVITFNKKEITQTVSLYIHPAVEQVAVEVDKGLSVNREKIVEKFVEGATGIDIAGTTAGILYDAANDCGPHAKDQSGKRRKVHVKEFTISIGGEGPVNPQDPPVAQAIQGDCAIQIALPNTA